MQFLRKIPKFFWGLLFFILLVIFIFRSILVNITTNLPDWLDYSLIVWIINQNTQHIKSLQIDNFFNSNIFYSFEGTMLFSDLLLPSSILALIFQIFSSNLVLVFNLVFFATLPLNIWSSYLFWKIFFKKDLIIFFGTLITAFSPYFFLELNHFQLLNFWPVLFGLYFLFKDRFVVKNAILVGLMLSLEFLSSVYLWVFMIFAIGIWYFMKLVKQYLQDRVRSKVFSLQTKNIIIHGFIVLLTFSVISGLFVLKYVQIKQSYNIVRSSSEYILYSAHLTDYVFTTYYHSFISTSGLANFWNNFNMHKVGESATFPGFVLLFLGVLGLVNLRRISKESLIGINLSFNNIYFLILIIIGFLFSLGPRLNVNGIYTGIPLPYYIVLKFIPLVEPIRANARWMFLLFLGLNYFALKGFEKINREGGKGLIITAIFTSVFLLEIIPVNRTSGKKDYYPIVYQTIEQKCATIPKVLLEYPLTRFISFNNIIENLVYKNQFQLASVRHKCLLVNGYSGYTPKDYDRYEDQLFWAIEKRDETLFWKLLSERKVNFFKLNKESLYEDRVAVIENWLSNKEKAKIYLNDDSYLISEIFN